MHLNLSGCSALEELDAGACESLETLLIENAVSLKVLNLGEMDALCSWSGLSPFDQLDGSYRIRSTLLVP